MTPFLACLDMQNPTSAPRDGELCFFLCSLLPILTYTSSLLLSGTLMKRKFRMMSPSEDSDDGAAHNVSTLSRISDVKSPTTSPSRRLSIRYDLSCGPSTVLALLLNLFV